MRILHVIATLDPTSGGPAEACVRMAEAVAALGHEADIFTTDWRHGPNDAATIESTHRGVRIATFPVRVPRFWKRSPELRAALMREVGGYDLLHIHSLYLYHNLVAPMAARSFGKPYILRPHGLLDPYIWRHHRARKLVVELAFQNRAIRDAALLHYTSADERRISEPRALGTAGAVIPLGVDLPDRVMQVRQNPLRVLFLSRLHPKKGLDLLIPAFAELKRDFAGAELVVAGPDDGALEQAKALARKLGLGASVTFPGMLRGNAKARAFAEAGLFVLPSYSENFGIAVAEAMAACLPVAVSDQVNIHDDISQAGAGLVVPCAVAPLAAAMARVLRNPAEAVAMGRRGRALAERRYSWAAIGRELEATYEQLLAR